MLHFVTNLLALGQYTCSDVKSVYVANGCCVPNDPHREIQTECALLDAVETDKTQFLKATTDATHVPVVFECKSQECVNDVYDLMEWFRATHTMSQTGLQSSVPTFLYQTILDPELINGGVANGGITRIRMFQLWPFMQEQVDHSTIFYKNAAVHDAFFRHSLANELRFTSFNASIIHAYFNESIRDQTNATDWLRTSHVRSDTYCVDTASASVFVTATHEHMSWLRGETMVNLVSESDGNRTHPSRPIVVDSMMTRVNEITTAECDAGEVMYIYTIIFAAMHEYTLYTQLSPPPNAVLGDTTGVRIVDTVARGTQCTLRDAC